MEANHIDPLSVAHDDSGAYIAGVTWNALPGETEHGVSDAFIRRYSPTGDLLWSDQFGGTRHDIAYDVATSESGKIYVVGESEQVTGPHLGHGFIRRYDSDGGVVWKRTIGVGHSEVTVRSVAVMGGAIFVVGGTAGVFPGQRSAGGTDAFVMKLRPDGTRAWVREFGTTGTDLLTTVAATPRWTFVGGTSGPSMLVRKYDAKGDVRWSRTLNHGDFESEVQLAARGEAVYVVSEVWCRTSACPIGHSHRNDEYSYLRSFDLRGTLRWGRAVVFLLLGSSEHWIDTTPGTVLVGGYALRSFSTQDGSSLWRFPSDEPIEAVSAEGHVAYVCAAIGGPSYIARLRLP